MARGVGLVLRLSRACEGVVYRFRFDGSFFPLLPQRARHGELVGWGSGGVGR